ncbi:hypothetical protein D9619_005797 [Psilocybe cf. subviscida]|uniref:Uncharacterized protein n=1 Tax=Psilocybe cf. subviscida TaxID=2480587 RepID=A0A8H5BYE9_9AGAR|nr:hypothetical protein D9619_005797 [Psilocybe cf. subviscida]
MNLLIPLPRLTRPFRPWLDAARVIFIILTHGGIAILFAVKSPSFKCIHSEGTSVNQESVCTSLIIYLNIFNWLIPALAIVYGAGLVILVRKLSKQSLESDATGDVEKQFSSSISDEEDTPTSIQSHESTLKKHLTLDFMVEVPQKTRARASMSTVNKEKLKRHLTCDSIYDVPQASTSTPPPTQVARGPEVHQIQPVAAIYAPPPVKRNTRTHDSYQSQYTVSSYYEPSTSSRSTKSVSRDSYRAAYRMPVPNLHENVPTTPKTDKRMTNTRQSFQSYYTLNSTNEARHVELDNRDDIMSMKWDPTTVKAQLRQASQRLAQVQARNDAQANIIWKDIATLLQRSDVSVARDKAEKLILDEAYGDFLEELIMQIGVLLEHFLEVERGSVTSPVTVEAASTVIYSAPYVQTKDLDAIRVSLVQRLGPDFTRSAVGNRDQHVSRRALKAITVPIPSAFQLDSYMLNVAESYNISWIPEAPRSYNVNALSEILDLDAAPEVDMLELKKLCIGGTYIDIDFLTNRYGFGQGFGNFCSAFSPQQKRYGRQIWISKERHIMLLEPVSLLQASSSLTDSVLLEAHKELSGLPKDLWTLLEDAETFVQCPLHEEAAEEIRIPYARTLEARLKTIHQQDETYAHSSPMPEIRLEPESDPVPAISLTPSEADDASDAASTTSSTQPAATTLLPSRKRIFGTAHPVHCSALLRLLYLHNVINPGNVSLYTSSYLVPLYSALVQEVNVEDLAHAEADTFWILEAMVAEFTGLEDDEGRIWMTKFSDRVAWADFDYKTHLRNSGKLWAGSNTSTLLISVVNAFAVSYAAIIFFVFGLGCTILAPDTREGDQP